MKSYRACVAALLWNGVKALCAYLCRIGDVSRVHRQDAQLLRYLSEVFSGRTRGRDL